MATDEFLGLRGEEYKVVHAKKKKQGIQMLTRFHSNRNLAEATADKTKTDSAEHKPDKCSKADCSA